MGDQKKIPKGKLRRSGVVGVAAAKVGAKKVGQIGKAPFLSRQERLSLKDKTDEEIAKIIFDALCVLRGTALKAAQLIAMEIEFIPEVYRKELCKASSQVPPMNRALLRKTIRTELGAPEHTFALFEVTPFAAASLGQVHAAKAFDGRDLAVKVQYLGIAEGVASDIKMLKLLLAPTRYARIFEGCFDEISRKVAQELDYCIEAQNTIAFSDAASPHLVIPEVATELSTQKVLSTTRIEGLHLDGWLSTGPSQSRRDHYGQMLVDFFDHCVHHRHVIHADPNPGNFLFRDDGRLGIVDFGCIKRLSPAFVQTISALTTPDRSWGLDDHEELHNQLGIHYRSDVDRKAFGEFMSNWISWLQEPYRTPVYDFAIHQDYFARGTHFAKQFYRYIDRYDGAFVYYGRTVQGVLRLLHRLGARVKMASWAAGDPPSPKPPGPSRG